MNETTEHTKLTRLVERRNLLRSELRGESIDDIIQDAGRQIDLQDFCAEIAQRECPNEARGLRCFNCRPLLIGLRSRVATHYATFQARPPGPQ